ncbi:hypothetical protein VPHK290_0025 [Vibrio phage K290]
MNSISCTHFNPHTPFFIKLHVTIDRYLLQISHY